MTECNGSCSCVSQPCISSEQDTYDIPWQKLQTDTGRQGKLQPNPVHTKRPPSVGIFGRKLSRIILVVLITATLCSKDVISLSYSPLVVNVGEHKVRSRTSVRLNEERIRSDWRRRSLRSTKIYLHGPTTATSALFATDKGSKGKAESKTAALLRNEQTEPMVREVETEGDKVLAHLQGMKQNVVQSIGEGNMQSAFYILGVMVDSVDELRQNEKANRIETRGGVSSNLLSAASAVVDSSLRFFTDSAFAPPRRGNRAVERVHLGTKAVQLQLSPGCPLSQSYNVVPRGTVLSALVALTAIRPKDIERSVVDGREFDPADESFRMLQRLVTGKGISRGKKNAPNDVVTLDERDFSMVLNAYANAGRMDMAHKVVALQERTQQAPPLSPVAYSILIKGYGRLRDADNIRMILSHAEMNGVQSDTIMLNSLIDAYINCDLEDEAREVFHQMRKVREYAAVGADSLPRPNGRTYNTMLKGLAKRGELEEALKLSREMHSARVWNDVTTNTLVHAAVTAKQFSVAEKLLTNFTSTVDAAQTDKGRRRGQQRQHPNVEAYTELLDGYSKAGNFGKALGTLQLMRKRGVKPNAVTYTCAICALAREGKISSAKNMLQFMESAGINPNVITYNSFITTLVASPPPVNDSENFTNNTNVGDGNYSDRVNEALGLLDRMINSGVRPNAITATALVESLGHCNPARGEEAKMIVKKLDKDGIIPLENKRVATALIKTCAKGDDFQGCVNAFRCVPSPDVVALNAFLDACCRCGQAKAAFDTFAKFVGTAGSKKNNGIAPDVITYSVLISALLKIKTAAAAKRARLLYREMKRKRGIQPDIALVNIILIAMTSGGQLGLEDCDIQFTLDVLRDSENLEWEPGQYEMRKKAVRAVLVGRVSEVWKEEEDLEDELFKRKGWNKVDSGFRLWGGDQWQRPKRKRKGSIPKENVVDEFLESKGWNDVDSGFRIL